MTWTRERMDADYMPVAILRLLVLTVMGQGLIGACCSPGEEWVDPIEVRVVVLNFDPLMPQYDFQPLHLAMGWQNPRDLAEEYRLAVGEVSHWGVRYQIVEWLDLNAFPVKTDGFQETSGTWLTCWRNRETCHDPDGADYPLLLRTYGAGDRIDEDLVDEVWLFGAPYMGFWESAMAGPGAFYINGGVYPEVTAERAFAIMGFSYERQLAEMLHDLCHRTEATLSRIHGGWQADQLTTAWARFAANAHQSGGVAAVGSCHYPPNGESDYDYANPREVMSSAADWLDYPELNGATAPVSCETWGGPDHHLNFMRWWFWHLPHAPETGPDGRLNDWWTYVFCFNDFDDRGLPAPDL